MRTALATIAVALATCVNAAEPTVPRDETAAFLVAVKSMSPRLGVVLTDVSASYTRRCQRTMRIPDYRAVAERSPDAAFMLALLATADAPDSTRLPPELAAKYSERAAAVPCDLSRLSRAP